ncbi:MAG: GGDEF domain-containing protein [Deltaproteobacteria bacterium]|nr:GGDEF domain-containing protein [Deltaproteobacteria bacterium]
MEPITAPKKEAELPSGEKLEEFNSLMESSYQKAKRLLPFMAKQRVPLTPYNYRIFFDYFDGQNAYLKQKLDKYLQERVLFTPELSERLYREIYDYSEERNKQLSSVSRKFETVSQDLGKNLNKTLNSTGHYRQILSESVAQINSQGATGDSIQAMLSSLLEETKYALNDQSDLADHILSTNKIIATLTSELRDQTRLANMDELTQLYNRRYFSVRFQQMLQESEDDPLICIAIFDLDHFKAINDNFGHPIGDKVLILCAKILLVHSHDDCLPVRYGGEEFILLTRGKAIEEVAELAETVRRKVEATEVKVRGNSVPVTISGGVSRYRPGEELIDFIERADQALYRAKASGRNRVLLEEPLS